MKRIFKDFSITNNGFTLLELAVSIAISSVLLGGLITAIYQFTHYPPKVQANAVVIQQAQNLSYWISRDGQMIQDADIGDDPNTVENEVFTFSWVGAEEIDINKNECIYTYRVTYVYDNGGLTRYENMHIDKYESDGDWISSADSQKTTVIAEYVSDIEGSMSNARFNVSATFSYDNAQVQRTYDITPKTYFLN